MDSPMTRSAAPIALLAIASPLLLPYPASADGPEKTVLVKVRFLGGAARVPLEGLTVTVFRSTGHYTADKKSPTARATADATGTAAFTLVPGRHYVEIDSEKERPYLRLPVGFKGQASLHDFTIDVTRDRRAFEFRLADACRLTLRAIDADTGRPLPGVTFVTENAAGEYWATPVAGHNLGAKPETAETSKAGTDGALVRLVGPHEGFTYYVWSQPEGYEPVDPAEVEIPTPVGTAKAEHVFKFRKAR
jgi:hypothetical protein